MAGICVAAITAAALQGCASSGTVAASGGPTGPATALSSTSAKPTAAASSVASSSSQASAPDSPSYSDPFAILTSDAPSTAVAPPPNASGRWTPQGDLANAEPVDVKVNPDKSVTATWPKGAPAGHALVVKLRAVRNGGKIVISLNADNQSGQQVSMNEGVFTGGAVLDAQGNSLNMEDFDSLWTLHGSSDGDIHPGQPLVGDFVVDAPASGSTLNAYWTQAIMHGGIMSGIILIRDIPIN